MQWLIHHLPSWAFPGICVTIFSLLALVLTIIPLPADAKATKTKVLKVGVIVIAAVLCVSEIAIIKKDRDDTLKQHRDDMDKIAGYFEDEQSLLLGVQKNQTIIEMVTPRADSLKRSTIDLSNDILQFLLNREVVPGFGQGPFGEEPFGGRPNDTEAYDKGTISHYIVVFEPQVRVKYEALKAHGLTDSQLEQEYGNPANTYSIKDTAERLTNLASRLPD